MRYLKTYESLFKSETIDMDTLYNFPIGHGRTLWEYLFPKKGWMLIFYRDGKIGDYWMIEDACVNLECITCVELDYCISDGKWELGVGVKDRHVYIKVGRYDTKKEAKEKYNKILKLIHSGLKSLRRIK